MMNEHEYKIIHHKLSIEIFEDAVRYLSAIARGNEYYSPSELEKYARSVSYWIARISDCFHDLKDSRDYLRHLPSDKWFKSAEIVKGDYVNYHYIKYTISIGTIMDVCLILTNDIFRLGNTEKLCTYENIIKNSWVIKYKVDNNLKKIGKITEPWHAPRNLFIHRGEKINRPKLLAITILQSMDVGSLRNQKNDVQKKEFKSHTKLSTIAQPKEIEEIFRKELAVVIQHLDTIETPLFNAIIELLTRLLPVYKTWSKNLQ